MCIALELRRARPAFVPYIEWNYGALQDSSPLASSGTREAA